MKEELVTMAKEESFQPKFEPGSIHKKDVFEFWKNNLKASDWVLKTLEFGYKIPFESLPDQYEEKNNASALANMVEVRKEVAKMIELGVVKVVRQKPHCVSPLGLVSRTIDGKIKHRLVFDASRCVNLAIKDQHVTLSHIEKVLEMTEKDDLQCVFDLKSAFYHIRIAEEDQKFLGAAITNSDNTKTYFIYQHLPFGLKCAVHAITKIMKPVIAHLQLKGIRSSIYIDDGRILAKSKDEASVFLKEGYKVLEEAGWQLELEKSDNVNEGGAKVKKYLGFLIDTEQMKVHADE